MTTQLDQMFDAPGEVDPKARIALTGAAGAGKTYTALVLAAGLAEGGPVVVIDSEHGSASKYRNLGDFRVAPPDRFARVARRGNGPDFTAYDPRFYIAAVRAASEAGAAVIVLDTVSHAWLAAKELVDMVKTGQKNSFTAWGVITPMWNALVDTIMGSTAHVIVTMRSKPQYILEERERRGRSTSVPVKVGMAPEIRDGTDHAFDIIIALDEAHLGTVVKTRMPSLDGRLIDRPGAQLAADILAWLKDGSIDTKPFYERAAEVGHTATGLLAGSPTVDAHTRAVTAAIDRGDAEERDHHPAVKAWASQWFNGDVQFTSNVLTVYLIGSGKMDDPIGHPSDVLDTMPAQRVAAMGDAIGRRLHRLGARDPMEAFTTEGQALGKRWLTICKRLAWANGNQPTESALGAWLALAGELEDVDKAQAAKGGES